MLDEIASAGKNHRFEDIVRLIQDDIISKKIKPGDKLPSERDLVNLLNVSRASLREALRVLEQKGLLEIRRGTKGGAFVTEPSSGALAEDFRLLVEFNRLSLDQIADFRKAIESMVTAIAARHADINDIRMLKRDLEKVRQHAGRGHVDDFINADKSLHLDIARISRNPILVSSLEAALGQERYFCRFLQLRPDLMESNCSDLSAIVLAMENNCPEKAGQLALQHINRFNVICH